jgi:hypothetical protein
MLSHVIQKSGAAITPVTAPWRVHTESRRRFAVESCARDVATPTPSRLLLLGGERVRYNFTFSERPDLHLPDDPSPHDCPLPATGLPHEVSSGVLNAISQMFKSIKKKTHTCLLNPLPS